MNKERIDVNEFKMQRNWSFEDLAKISGISEETWMRMANGDIVDAIVDARAQDFMRNKGRFTPKKQYWVLYQQNAFDGIDYTPFSEFWKARLFCDALSLRLTPRDRKNGGFCLISDDFAPVTGDFSSVLCETVEEHERLEKKERARRNIDNKC